MNTVSMAEVKNLHTGKWFDASSMRFFNTRLPKTAVKIGDDYYFISSDKFGPNSDRKYTVRIMTKDGQIHSHSEFQQFETKNQAEQFLLTNSKDQ